MILRHKYSKRRGAVLVFLALGLTVLCGFTALAIDIGIVAVARSQCQNAADAGAMAGVRTLNGDVANNNNFTNAAPNAIAAATANYVLVNPITASMVNVQLGSYSYDSTQQKFTVQVPKLTNDNWTLARVTVSATIPTFFGRIFGVQTMNPTATSTAVHRPRDVSIILDFSGSMRFDSLLGIPFSGPRTKSNNPESVFPLFGHYSDTATAALQNTAAYTVIGTSTYGSANITVDTASGPAIVKDFYKHTNGSAVQLAFAPADDGYANTPDGDNFLKTNLNAGATYAKTVNEVLNTTSYHVLFETNGYTQFTTQPYKGYTVGPRYWGKSFFVWPPDPRPAHDWRRRFFFKGDGVTPCDDNTLLFSTSGGGWRTPGSSSYRINYSAILQWLKTNGNNPFPPKMRSGRVLFYDGIPDSINTSPQPPTDPNERFWKDYIDYVLGLQQADNGTWTPIASYTGYGDDFTWGTPQITAKPTGTAPQPYMNYNDNPKRPRLRTWFGPMTMIDFLGNYNLANSYAPRYWWWPGTVHESPMWQLKVGIQSSLKDIQFNHPNDWVTMMNFSSPQVAAGDPVYGRWNRVRSPLGRSYTRMIDQLWFTNSTIDNPTTEIRTYDSTNYLEVPHAKGGTSPTMGFMLTYNQYSNNSSLATWAPAPAPPGEAGGFGRRGAQKLVILETDGVAKNEAGAVFVNGGANTYSSYFKIRFPGEYPSDASADIFAQCYGVVDKLVALDSASPPGYTTTRKPVLIHCLAFGTLFEPANATADKDSALEFLQTIQFKGKTQDAIDTPLPSYKMIVGTADERITKLQQAFSNIMQDGVQVTLIQ
jgi:Flp pilus assembly protein TadG